MTTVTSQRQNGWQSRRRVRRNGGASSGFTLIEALIAVVLVGVGVVAVFGGIRALTAAQSNAETADLLQRLAVQELNVVTSTTSDPTTANTSGDFTEIHPWPEGGRASLRDVFRSPLHVTIE